MNDTKQLLVENELLAIQISQRQHAVDLKIESLQQLLVRCEKSMTIRQKKQHAEHKQQRRKIETTATRSSVCTSTVVQDLDRFLTEKEGAPDVYRLSILLSRGTKTHRVQPSAVRRALFDRVFNDIRNEHTLKRVIINILLPQSVKFDGRIPYHPSSWAKRRKQLPLSVVAQRMMVPVEHLKEKIISQLLSSTVPFTSVDFEKLSTSICGMDELATEIFVIANSIVVRPDPF